MALKKVHNDGTKKILKWWYEKLSTMVILNIFHNDDTEKGFTMMILKRFHNGGIKNSLKIFTHL